MGQWRNDWVEAQGGPMGAGGGWILSGENAGDQAGQAGRAAGPGGSEGFAGAPGPVGYGPGYWYYDNFGGPNQRASTGNDPGAGAANPSASDHGAAAFGQGGTEIKLPRGAQSDTGY